MTAEVDLPPAAEDRLRAALAAATTGPVPPAWDAIRERVEVGDVVTLRPARRREALLLAAAAVVAVAAVGGLAVATTRGNDGDVTAAGRSEAYCAVLERASRAGRGVVVFLEPGPAPDPTAVERAIDGTGLAEEATYVDLEASYADARALFADEPTLRDLLRPEDIPTSVHVLVADGDAARAIAAAVEDVPGVLTVERTHPGRVVDVLQTLAGGVGHRPLGARWADDDVADALGSTVPDELADDAATIDPVLRSGQDPDQNEADAAGELVADADGRCGMAPIEVPEGPVPEPDGAATTTEPG